MNIDVGVYGKLTLHATPAFPTMQTRKINHPESYIYTRFNLTKVLDRGYHLDNPNHSINVIPLP